MDRSTFLPLQHTATLIFSVDWGLTKFGKTLRVVNLTMGELEEIVHLVAANAIAHGDVEYDADAVAELYEALVEKAVHESPAIILKDINRNSSTGLRRRRRARQGFEGRLWKHWKKPLLLLELMVELAHEIGVGIGDQVREETPITYDYTFIALQAIHARACQMSRAILALLRAGFPDDAHARWRSLHELAVVSAFISECEEDVAERYVLHEVVEQRKLAQHYKGSETWNQLDPEVQREIEELETKYQSLLNRYGRAFKEDYGWAESILGIERPNFAQIEQHVEMAHWRPDYRMASDNVHPNARGTFYKTSQGVTDRTVLLAGPSNMGLADPGDCTARSLLLITAAFVATNLTVDSEVQFEVLQLLRPKTSDAFLQAGDEAERIAAKKRRRQ